MKDASESAKELGMDIEETITRYYSKEIHDLSDGEVIEVLSALSGLLMVYAQEIPDMRKRRDIIDTLIRVVREHVVKEGMLQ